MSPAPRGEAAGSDAAARGEAAGGDRAAPAEAAGGDRAARGEAAGGDAAAPGGAVSPPPGYLGAEGRVRSGPAPELVAAGYELELADADLLHGGLTLADLAHVIAHPAIPDGDRRTLLRALLELDAGGPAIEDPRYGDLVNVRERELEQRIGTAAGWLNAGRPRREAGRIAFRVALRTRVLDLEQAALRLATALTDQATRERDTPMPDFTYLQAAQPTTAGHWLLSHAAPALRDAERTARDFAAINQSPAGAGGVNGSRYPLDRERLAALLGFDAPITHTRDAMWRTDDITETTHHAATVATTASRFAEDVELYSSDEFGLIRIGDAFCRASALMPQKRNPYALVVIRGAAGTLLGRATGVLATQRTPSGRTDNLLYAYGEVTGAVELATRTVDLAAAVTESLDFNAAELPEATFAADVAEALTRHRGIDYRTAYKIVAAGGELGFDPAPYMRFDAAMATRTVTGGAAPGPMDAMLADTRETIAAATTRLKRRREALRTAEAALRQLAVC
ncbi:lyase family protein [Solirubrobacter soli]|uniref:lyase family protein n=1 Tax=Solirubrobacter soli TaxID=363832 RepID=UPI0003FF2397|nr:lyase family protein [Solirubrobacter soli]